ncbi:MAG: DUF4342 domain-containing protein [Clostridia bacterium]|nr:DUF4342 domain-containing protein [Clostridia bacterium]
MEITLEKIELVKDRTGSSYKEAKEALEAAEGSVVDAIINIEENMEARGRNRFGDGSGVVEKIKEMIKKGNVARILIKKDDETVLNLPVNAGIIGAVIAPVPVVLATLAAFGTKCVIELIKDDGAIIDVSEMANETISKGIEKGSIFADEVKSKGADVYQNVIEKANEAMAKAINKDDDYCCYDSPEDDSEEDEKDLESDDSGCCCDDSEE